MSYQTFTSLYQNAFKRLFISRLHLSILKVRTSGRSQCHQMRTTCRLLLDPHMPNAFDRDTVAFKHKTFQRSVHNILHLQNLSKSCTLSIAYSFQFFTGLSCFIFQSINNQYKITAPDESFQDFVLLMVI